MKWIGLTGGIASGKSTVSARLRSMGVPVIDADIIARQVVEKGSEGLAQVVQKFGPGILSPSGELDRDKLGQIIFQDPSKRKELESIIHPLVQFEVAQQRRWLQDQGTSFAFYDVPLLFENNLQQQFDRVVVVYAPFATLVERLVKRNGFSAEQASLRIRQQIDIEEKKAKADFVLDNTGSVENLSSQVDKLVNELEGLG